MTFLDTNVFVYEIDVRDPVKQRKATSILLDARDSGDYVISAQVLNEFANVAMRKFGKTREETLAFVELFRAIRTVPVYGLQFYDSLLVAAAEATGCDEILTEDLADGQTYCGVKASNPFA